MRIVIASSGQLGASVMAPMLGSAHEVVGLLRDGRGKSPRDRRREVLRARFLPPEIDPLSQALRNGVPVLWIDACDATELDAVRPLDPDLIIACGFGIIFNAGLLSVPNIGCINVHSSLLPKHRGASPFAHVVLANEIESGVTIHAMEESIDTGAILGQEKFALTPTDTSVSVYHRCCDLAYDAILDIVDDIEVHGLRGTPQDDAESTYDPRMTEEIAAIDWRDPAEKIERLVRAALAYQPAWFMHRGKIIRVHRATFDPRPVEAEPGAVLDTKPYPVVATGLGRLIIHEAHATRPIPWTWPAPWSRLKAGAALNA